MTPSRPLAVLGAVGLAVAATGCNDNSLLVTPGPNAARTDANCFPYTENEAPFGPEAATEAGLAVVGADDFGDLGGSDRRTMCATRDALGQLVDGRWEEGAPQEPLHDLAAVGNVVCKPDRGGGQFAVEYEAPYDAGLASVEELDAAVSPATPLRFSCEIETADGTVTANFAMPGWATTPDYTAEVSGYESGIDGLNGSDPMQGALPSRMDNNFEGEGYDADNYSVGNPCLVLVASDAPETGNWSVSANDDGEVECIGGWTIPAAG